MRIVSLVPSLTETICALGLRDQLVACTKFCVEPRDLRYTADIVGGTKDFNVDAILKLKPTHIFCNQEENPKEPVEALMKHVPMLVTFPKSPADVPEMLRAMGRFLGGWDAFEETADTLDFRMQCAEALPEKRFLYFIWQNPYMLAGRDTYISRFLESWGLLNACASEERYPIITVDGISAAHADLLLLSSEPYPFRKRDADRLRTDLAACPPIHKVDGQMLSWFGTRTLLAWDYMEKIRQDGLPPL